MTTTQTVEIPADRRITLEVPPQIPSGTTARFDIIWFPINYTVNNLDIALEKIWTLCKETSVSVDSFLEVRRHDKELEENQYRQFVTGFKASN